jgi:hypothetical protein
MNSVRNVESVLRIFVATEVSLGAGIAQSVQRLATGCTSEESEFDFRLRQKFSILQFLQTGSEAHPAYYPMDTGGKAA